MHHIPTRTEMDEMQRSVTELKRELRAMKRENGGSEVHGTRPAKAKASSHLAPRTSNRKRK